MKTTLKLLISLGLALGASAQTVFLSGVTAAATVKQAATNGVALLTLTVTDTSGTNQVVYIHDNSASTTNRVRPAYTAMLSYPTNQVVSYTNIAGVVTSVTNAIQYTATTTVSAVTNSSRIVNAIQLPASGTVTWLPTTPQGFTYGVQLQSVYPTAYQLNYVPLP